MKSVRHSPCERLCALEQHDRVVGSENFGATPPTANITYVESLTRQRHSIKQRKVDAIVTPVFVVSLGIDAGDILQRSGYCGGYGFSLH